MWDNQYSVKLQTFGLSEIERTITIGISSPVVPKNSRPEGFRVFVEVILRYYEDTIVPGETAVEGFRLFHIGPQHIGVVAYLLIASVAFRLFGNLT